MEKASVAFYVRTIVHVRDVARYIVLSSREISFGRIWIEFAGMRSAGGHMWSLFGSQPVLPFRAFAMLLHFRFAERKLKRVLYWQCSVGQ